MSDVKIVNMSWASRICAVLFGEWRVVETDGIRLYVSWWRGVLYILYVRRLTSAPANSPEIAVRGGLESTIEEGK